MVLIQDRNGHRLINTVQELQDFTGIYELPMDDVYFNTMIDNGQVWNNEKLALEVLNYVWQCSKSYAYLKFIERQFREGKKYDFVVKFKPSDDLWNLPEKYPFGNEWCDQAKSISFGIALAFDLLMLSTQTDRKRLVAETGAPEKVVEESYQIRSDALEGSIEA